MKTAHSIWFLLFLLVAPGLVYAASPTIVGSGVIGDFSGANRIYEVNGRMYTFPPDIPIQNRYGKALDFTALKGGVLMDVPDFGDAPATQSG